MHRDNALKLTILTQILGDKMVKMKNVTAMTSAMIM